jgi:hypothetical protein
MKEKQPKENQPKQEKEFSIKAVKELPLGQRLKGSFYDTILDQCIADKANKIFEISVKGKDGKDKHWKSTYAPIDCRILKKRYPLKIFIREGKLYLQKYDTFEEMFKLRKVHKKKNKKAE